MLFQHCHSIRWPPSHGLMLRVWRWAGGVLGLLNTSLESCMVSQGAPLPAAPAPPSPEHQLAPFRQLLHSLCGKVRQGVSPEAELPPHTMEAVDRMSGTELRDHLLAIDPLDHLWVARVNQVRAPPNTSLCPPSPSPRPPPPREPPPPASLTTCDWYVSTRCVQATPLFKAPTPTTPSIHTTSPSHPCGWL